MNQYEENLTPVNPVEEETETKEENELNEQPAGKKGKKEKLTGWARVKKEVREWVVSLAVAIVSVFLISNYLFLPIRVSGASMNPTLANGERLWVTAYDVRLSNKLEKGDIIICNYPGRTNKDPILGLVTMKTNFVKRVVGVAGDTVSRERGVTYINGEPLDINKQTSVSYTLKEKTEITLPTGETETRYLVVHKNYRTGRTAEQELTYNQIRKLSLDYEYVLGEDEYFAVGDNRYNSHDSRDWNGPEVEKYITNDVSGDVGPITSDMIVGRAKLVFWPLGEWEKLPTDPYYAYPGDPVPSGKPMTDGGMNENE